jgi:hypothetical protein
MRVATIRGASGRWHLVQPQAVPRAVRTVLRDLLATPGLRGTPLVAAIQAAGDALAIEPFGACLALLAAGRASEAEARPVIEAIESHRAVLESRLLRDPGFAVAAADLLHASGAGGWAGGTGRGTRPPAPQGRSRSFDEIVECEVRRHYRTGRPLGLILMAPAVPPDERGWRDTIAALVEAARDVDQLARVLPEGVAAILPCTSGDEAVRAAARFRSIASRIAVTAWSTGVAALPGLPAGAATLAAAARRALEDAVRDGAAVRRAAPERRRHGRRPAAEGLNAQVRTGRQVADATVEDMSLGGMLIRIPRPLVPGLLVALEIGDAPPRARRLALGARVVRSEAPVPGTNGAWRAALRFEAGAGALPALAEMLAAGRAPERRS